MFETEIHQYDATVTKYQREIEGPLGKEQHVNAMRSSFPATVVALKDHRSALTTPVPYSSKG